MHKIILFILIILCVACKTLQNNEVLWNNEEYLINWWERYYKNESSSENFDRITHVEFFKDFDVRVNFVHFDKENNFTSATINGKWIYSDSLKKNIDILSWGEIILTLEVLRLSKEELIFSTSFSGNKDTIYMKSINK
jgi:hypothetical protein